MPKKMKKKSLTSFLSFTHDRQTDGDEIRYIRGLTALLRTLKLRLYNLSWGCHTYAPVESSGHVIKYKKNTMIQIDMVSCDILTSIFFGHSN